ncbi:MAG: ScpA family protein [Gemmatimonadota bacterium]|nr:ScpA family protein [Gemmatimonadota bacterium]
MTGDGLLVVETDRFHGPLDLLLHLIRTQDIDIFDIPIARITRQFLEAIEVLADTSVDEAGEFLEMAAVLVRIKARMLLPAPAGEEDHDPRADLVHRLLEYEMIREVAARLRAAEDDRGRRFEKGFVQPRPRPGAAEVPLEVTWEDLWAAALRVEAPVDRNLDHRVAARRVALREKVGLIVETVRRTRRIDFASLVAPWRERIHGVMTLLAGLELGRRRVVSLRQREHFSPLWFYGGRNLDDGFGEMVPGVAPGADEVVGRGVSASGAQTDTLGVDEGAP